MCLGACTTVEVTRMLLLFDFYFKNSTAATQNIKALHRTGQLRKGRGLGPALLKTLGKGQASSPALLQHMRGRAGSKAGPIKIGAAESGLYPIYYLTVHRRNSRAAIRSFLFATLLITALMTHTRPIYLKHTRYNYMHHRRVPLSMRANM